jgi:RNA polymerase sigma-70 factor (ECF subfamily)
MQIEYALSSWATSYLRANVAERSDETLIESIAGGDKLAMRVLFARHYVRVYRFALRLTGNSATAEDIVNDVFFDVWRKSPNFEAKSQVSTCLLAITRYKALSSARRHSESQLDEEIESTIVDAADNPEDSTDKKGRSAILRHCLRQLSPAQREVIDLVYYHEMSVAEVSAIVDAPEKTVKTRMFYTRKLLSELLAVSDIHTACS